MDLPCRFQMLLRFSSVSFFGFGTISWYVFLRDLRTLLALSCVLGWCSGWIKTLFLIPVAVLSCMLYALANEPSRRTTIASHGHLEFPWLFKYKHNKVLSKSLFRPAQIYRNSQMINVKKTYREFNCMEYKFKLFNANTDSIVVFVLFFLLNPEKSFGKWKTNSWRKPSLANHIRLVNLWRVVNQLRIKIPTEN